jgi:hypothetical protein
MRHCIVQAHTLKDGHGLWLFAFEKSTLFVEGQRYDATCLADSKTKPHLIRLMMKIFFFLEHRSFLIG